MIKRYFEPGDKVRIIGNGDNKSTNNIMHHFVIGSVGEVTRCIKHEREYAVKVDGMTQFVSAQHIELVYP